MVFINLLILINCINLRQNKGGGPQRYVVIFQHVWNFWASCYSTDTCRNNRLSDNTQQDVLPDYLIQNRFEP